MIYLYLIIYYNLYKKKEYYSQRSEGIVEVVVSIFLYRLQPVKTGALLHMDAPLLDL